MRDMKCSNLFLGDGPEPASTSTWNLCRPDADACSTHSIWEGMAEQMNPSHSTTLHDNMLDLWIIAAQCHHWASATGGSSCQVVRSCCRDDKPLT
jgi:hypothetical protein